MYRRIIIKKLFTGKVIALLEGGYFLPSLAESAALTLKTLLGDPGIYKVYKKITIIVCFA